MKIICKPRGAGKTTELIKLAAESGGIMVVHSYAQAQNTVDLARSMGLDILYPITYHEFVGRKYYANNFRCLLIDDVEWLLQYMARNTPIHAVTISEEG